VYFCTDPLAFCTLTDILVNQDVYSINACGIKFALHIHIHSHSHFKKKKYYLFFNFKQINFCPKTNG
jgi:hypothetical protein